jgi:hypothetical protein
MLDPVSNWLVCRIIRFLDIKDITLEEIQDFINESDTAQSVPACAFLVFWLCSKSYRNDSATIQNGINLAEVICRRIPPVLLMTSLLDLKWNNYRPENTYSENIINI